MERSPVYLKTELGVSVLREPRATLAPAARHLLILIDGRRDLAELSAVLGTDTVERWLPSLANPGYVRQRIEALTPALAPAPALGQPFMDEATRPVVQLDSRTLNQFGQRTAGLLAFRLPEGLPERLSERWAIGRTRLLATAGSLVTARLATGLALALVLLVWSWWWLAHGPAVPASPLPAPSHLYRHGSETDLPLVAAPASAGASEANAAPSASAGAQTAPLSALAPVATMRLSEAAPAAIAEPQVPTPEDSYSRTRVLPDLPPAAQRLGINHGQVLVRLHLSAAGTVNRVELVRADAPQLFDAQVRRTLEGWTYEPTGRVQQKIVELNFHP